MPVPFYDAEFTFTQPDGSKIKVKGWGDQFHAVFETLEGYSIVQNPITRFFEYAKLSRDENRLELTGAIVGVADPEKLGLAKHIRVSKEVERKTARATFDQSTTSKTRWRERIEEEKLAKRAAILKGPSRAPPSHGTIGKFVGLCIPIQFPDVAGTVSQAEIDDFCNMQGYNSFRNNGSVHDYYDSVSNGKVDYTIIVAPYYTAIHNKSHYTDETIPSGTRALELINEALADLKANNFDFSKLSVDNQNFVYAVNIAYAGPCVNNWAKGLWPFSGALPSPYFDIGNGRKIRDFQFTHIGNQPAINYDPVIGTFCHENGHMLCSFPDLYDYGYQSWGAGVYCLMALGNGDENRTDPTMAALQKNPAQICAYLKYKAGWSNPVTFLPGQPSGAKALNASMNEFCIFSKNATEYFIIENRFQQDRDKELPDSGLATWHIDELGSNNNEQMTSALHYECSLEQADGHFDLEHKANLGNAGDLFSAASSPSFDSFTVPDSKWWDGSYSKLTIGRISNPGVQMSFHYIMSLIAAAKKMDPTSSQISTRKLAATLSLPLPISVNDLIVKA
jgi:M6 family metalloprotease-like protein